MARRSLADIRDELKKEAENGGKKNFQGDNASYRFWSIPEETTAITRFLPDGDESNDDTFWVERLMINLDFSGVVGDADKNFARVQVPCMEMYGKEVACPVQADIKPWYKIDGMEEQANKYWKKRSFLYQGFVIDHPGFVDRQGKPVEDETPDNPIRRFVINPNLHKTIRAILLDNELENWPDDYDAGLNFNIRKTKDGQWASYDTSSWARKESALTDEQRAAISEHGLFVLKDYLPRKPTATDLKVIMEMFEASVDGEKYDPERWGAYYRPAGVQKPEGAKRAEAPEPKKESVPEVKTEAKVETPAEAPAESEADVEIEAPSALEVAEKPAGPAQDRAAEILARVRKKQTA